MLNLFSRRYMPPQSSSRARMQRPVDTATAPGSTARPDFDLSDFDEPTPTLPGSYWHTSDEQRDDVPRVS